MSTAEDSVSLPRVTVVIPVRNGERHIAAALESVLSQQDIDLDVIVSENFSTDGTADVLRHIADPRLRVVQPPQACSAADNWSFVTGLATGEFTKLVCHDDLLYPGALAAQAQALERDHSIAIVASRRCIVDAAGEVVLAARGLAGLRGRVEGPAAIARMVRGGTNIFGEPAAVLFRTSALQVALPWNPSHPYVIDVELYARILRTHALFADPDVRAAFRIGHASWSSQLRAEQATSFQWLASRERAELGLPIWALAEGIARAWVAQFARQGVFWLAARRRARS